MAPTVCAPARPVLPSERFKEQFKRTKLCRFFFGPGCKRGSACMFAHTENELQPRPDLQCTSLCPHLARGGVCNDPECQFAHDKTQLRVTSVFYKTGLCKDFQRGECLLGDQCRHAHIRDELQHSRTRSKEANSRRSSRSSIHSSNAETSQAEDTEQFADIDSRRGSLTSEQGNSDVEAKPNWQSQVGVGGIGAILSQMSLQPLPKRRVTAPGKLQKQLNLKFGGNDYISDDQSTASEEDERPSNQAMPEAENSPPSGGENSALLDLYNRYKENEDYAKSQIQTYPKPTNRRPAVTFGAAWAASNATTTANTGQAEPQQVPNVQTQGGYPNNAQAPQGQCFIPTFYMPCRGGKMVGSGQIPAGLPMPFGPNSNMDPSERYEIAEQLLQAQPEYYDD